MYYVAHRLFANHDRALGALVASELAEQVGPDRVFLPFCDTDEEDLVSDCKGRTLFELDSRRLQTLAGMIAILHGPSLDDGVCMEIGYATHLGVPVVALTTDFQTYGLTEEGPAMEFPDPLLEAVVTSVVRVSRLASLTEEPEDRFRRFLGRNLAPLRRAARFAVHELLSHSRHAPVLTHDEPRTAVTPGRAFLEPSPYQRPETSEAVHGLLTSRGWEVQTARRWEIPDGVTRADVLDHARRDWEALGPASLLVTDVNGPEAPPGAALLVGASVAAGRRSLASYEDRSFSFAPGREVNFRNLMIHYALDGRFRNSGELAALLDQL